LEGDLSIGWAAGGTGHADQVRLAEIVSQLADQHRDLAAMVGLVVKQMGEDGADGELPLASPGVAVTNRPVECLVVQRVDVALELFAGAFALPLELLPVGMQFLCQRFDEKGKRGQNPFTG
jgi:hypothetical protein